MSVRAHVLALILKISPAIKLPVEIPVLDSRNKKPLECPSRFSSF